jgi:transcriptional regulator with XRE-family HTH domain
LSSAITPRTSITSSSGGARVRELRTEQGRTQEDMMERGFSLRHYQRIEAGRSVTVRTLWKLSKAFGVEPSVLLPKRR